MKKGEKVLPIDLADINGRPVSLRDFMGQKIYLTFLRTAACPFCNLRVHELIKKQEYWKRNGLYTIAVFASSADEINRYAGRQRPPFTILADPEETLYRAYGIGKSRMGMLKAMLRMRTIFDIMRKGFFTLKAWSDEPLLTADFLIDESGIIQVGYYGKDFGDHLSFEEIEN